MSRKNDKTLRFYHEVLGLERLHYGMWQAEDDVTIAKFKEAQIRYEDFLIANIPPDVKKILDVGCGTGIMARKLLNMGYDVEGLSPDVNQKKYFADKLNAKFHSTKFENFTETNQFNCLIMSESSQYIKLEKLFTNAHKALKNGGYLIICDYFVKKNATGIQSKSGHKYDAFVKQISKSRFEIIKEKDITESVVKTLDIGKDFVSRIQKTVEIYTENIVKKHPHFTNLILWIGKKKIKKYRKQLQLLDSQEFKKNKTYRLFLLQAATES
ncbi:MAG: hypothetical protein DRI23_12010 [Candidatus Cloacimonadota bacterium]|nr:MAG: hypothetical protein DRI23_12010 [Candidatus Cloacimonadota bacterium]